MKSNTKTTSNNINKFRHFLSQNDQINDPYTISSKKHNSSINKTHQ